MSVVLLPANVAALAQLTADSSDRYAITGVRVAHLQNGHGAEYEVTATDGRLLGRVRGKQDDAAQFPKIEGLKRTSEAKEAVLPAKDFVQAMRAVPKKTPKPILSNLACHLGENVTTLATTNYEAEKVSQVRNLDGHFPEVQDVIPKQDPFFTIHVNPAQLKALCEVAAKFCQDVTLEFYGYGRIIALKGKNDQAQEFLGLLMPLTAPDDEDVPALEIRDRYLARAAKSSVKAVAKLKNQDQ